MKSSQRQSADLQPDAQPTNRRIGGKSYNPETGNTRKNKFSKNKTTTYPARKGGLSPHSVRFDTLGQTGCDKRPVTVEGRTRPHIAICAYRERA